MNLAKAGEDDVNATPFPWIIAWAVGMYFVARRSLKSRRTFYIMFLAWIAYLVVGLLVAVSLASLAAEPEKAAHRLGGLVGWSNITPVFASGRSLAR